MAEVRQVKTRNLIAYGFGELYGGGSFIIISLLFLFFLTDVVGLAPSLAGLIVLIGKFWDAVTDPLMGFISDNMRSRFGKRRVFFLVGVIPVAVTFLILWITVRFPSDITTFMYYAVSYILFSTTFTMVMIPYRALNAEMTPDYAIRTKLTGVKMIFSQASSLVCATVPKLIVDQLFPGDRSAGYAVMGIAFGIFFALPWLIVYFGTWELPVVERQRKKVVTIFRDFVSLFKNRSYRVQMGMYISSYSAMDLLMAMAVYYITYYLLKKEIYSLALGVLFITSISMLTVWVNVANKKGKGFAYIVGLSIFGVIMAGFLLVTSSTPTWIIVAMMVVVGAGLSAGVLMPWAILPSIIDVDELIVGEQRAGICSGAMTLFRKIVQSFALFIFGVLLDVIGYVPNVPQTADTLFWMKMIFFLAPGVCIIAGILFATLFKITPETHAILKAELERLREGGRKEDADPKTRKVCETLTGVEYQKLYGSG